MQLFGDGKAAHVEEFFFGIHNGGFTIYDIRKFGRWEILDNLLQSFVCMKFVPCVEEAKIVTGSQADSFVHGIVQPFVRFTDYSTDMLLVFIDNFQGIVFGASIHNDVFYLPIGLGDDTLYGFLQYLTSIVCHGNDREFGLWMLGIMHGLRLSCCILQYTSLR